MSTTTTKANLKLGVIIGAAFIAGAGCASICIIGGLLLIGRSVKSRIADAEVPAKPRAVLNDSPQWNKGGTLHRAEAVEWRVASPQNKLATCADLVTASLQAGHLRPSIAGNIRTSDDVRPLAEQLRKFIDTSFSVVAPSDARSQRLAKQNVNQVAAAGMLSMDWTR